MTTRAAIVCLLVFQIGCVGSGEVPTQVSGRMVGDDEKPIGPGIVFIERGKVHEGTYEVGGLIDAEGRFTIELPSGGVWGIHIFHDDYSYLPAEFTMEAHQQIVLTSPMISWGVWLDLTGLPTWPDQPADPALIRMPWDDNADDNPTLSNLKMTWASGDLLDVSIDAQDPDNDLSRMILAYNHATGAGYAMNPPGPPNEKGYYPNGTYTLKVYRDERDVPGESQWFFIVSDDLCNNSPILKAVLPTTP